MCGENLCGEKMTNMRSGSLNSNSPSQVLPVAQPFDLPVLKMTEAEDD